MSDKHKVTITIPKGTTKETAEFLLNLESYFLFEPTVRKRDICYNAGSPLCKKCEEPECDLARGWMKKDE